VTGKIGNPSAFVAFYIQLDHAMVKTTAPFALFAAVILLCVACEKEGPVRGNGGSQASSHIELAVDSACIQAPNFFTPNGDGVNDVFPVLCKNVASVKVRILNSANELVLENTDLHFLWNGQDSTGIGPYTVEVDAISSSGIPMFGKSSLHILDYDSGSCLNYVGTPVSPDQFDPRICGISYPSSDVLCP